MAELLEVNFEGGLAGSRGRTGLETARALGAAGEGEAPLVSIITPTYNQAEYLGDAIESVLGQDYPRIEYIVLDDGSTDGTREILARYEGRIQWVSHPNMGETLTVNKGFSMAHGEIIGILNSDDLLLPGAVRTAVEWLMANPDALVVYPDWLVIDGEGYVVGVYRSPEFSLKRMIGEHCNTVGAGAFFRRSAVELAGLRDPAFSYVADFDFWVRIALHGRLIRIPKVLAAFRVHPKSASEAKRGRGMAEEHVRLVKKMLELPGLPHEVKRMRRKALCYAYYHAGIYSGGDRAQAAVYLMKAVRWCPLCLPRLWRLVVVVVLPQCLVGRLRYLWRKWRRMRIDGRDLGHMLGRPVRSLFGG